MPPRFSTGTAGAAGIANAAASLIGNYTGGRPTRGSQTRAACHAAVLPTRGARTAAVLADTCFRMRLKAFLVLLFAGCAVSFAGYSLALPSLLSSSPLLPSRVIVVWTAAAGFFQGSLDPVLYELSAEIVRRPGPRSLATAPRRVAPRPTDARARRCTRPTAARRACLRG